MNSGIIIAPPGSGKTTLEAKLAEHWMETNPGPVIIISRVKSLVGQVLSNMVLLNKFHPDRIACYSDADHEMDLKDPLAVGTISNTNVEEVVEECFVNNRNIIIGAVVNHGSVQLLDWCLDKGYRVKVIVDELAEAIPGSEGEEFKNDKDTTLSSLYKLKDANLIDKLFGFDAVWKIGSYRGMNDAYLWGQDTPLILHKQDEMTYEKNVLCPVELIAVEINEDDLLSDTELNEDDRKRQIEIAANIKAVCYEHELIASGIMSVAKELCFSSGSDEAKFNKSEMTRYFGSKLELNEFVLAGTSQEHRQLIQQRMGSSLVKTGVISNYDIWTKGMDVQDLTGVILGYERLPSPEKLTHIIGRVTRRVPSERGLPIDQCKIKPCGRFYVPYLSSSSQGGGDYKHIVEVWQRLYSLGFTTVSQSLLRGSTTKTDDTVKKLTTVLVKIFEEVSDDDVDRINICKELIAAGSKINTQIQIDEHEQFKKLFQVKTVEEQYQHIVNTMPPIGE